MKSQTKQADSHQIQNLKTHCQNLSSQQQNISQFVCKYTKRRFDRCKQQLQISKNQLKNLHQTLIGFIQPERQQILQSLSNAFWAFQSAKKLKNQSIQSINIENEAKILKQSLHYEQKSLSRLIQKKLSLLFKIESLKDKQIVFCQHKESMLELKKLKQFKFQEIKQNHQKNFEKAMMQNSLEQNRQFVTLKNHLQNAEVHKQQLKKNLSQRYQLLIRIQTLKEQNLVKKNQTNAKNNELEDEIEQNQRIFTILQNKKIHEKQLINQQQIQLNSTKMLKIELKARLEMLRHSLKDQQSKIQSFKKKLQQNRNFMENAKLVEGITMNYLQKLVFLKLQSEYLENKCKETIISDAY